MFSLQNHRRLKLMLAALSLFLFDILQNNSDGGMNCKEHYLPELELATGQVREALQAILYTILL